jgi:hypothetical protein
MQNDPRVARIPSGPYCYNGKGKCPFWVLRPINGVEVVYCRFLQQGDIFNLSDEDFDTLKDYHNVTDDELRELYPLSLLWDQVKECGENSEY